LIGTDVALAVIPLGTANVLAHDLGVPSGAVAAARAALRAVPLRVSVGRADCQSNEGTLVTRYFLSVAGAGQDGYLFHRVVSVKSERLELGSITGRLCGLVEASYGMVLSGCIDDRREGARTRHSGSCCAIA